jgi:Fe-S oxidoreductase
MLTPFPTCIGHLRGFRIGIDVATLTSDLGELIRNGELTIFDSSSRTVSYHNARAA